MHRNEKITRDTNPQPQEAGEIGWAGLRSDPLLAAAFRPGIPNPLLVPWKPPPRHARQGNELKSHVARFRRRIPD
jgi:hypothetical protein